MRNDTARWETPGLIGVTKDGLTIAEVPGLRQHWVSGTDVLTRYADQRIGWPDIAPSDKYALALRRDRVLLVGDTDLLPGYSDETGLAVSDVSAGWRVIDISGPGAFECLRHGAELNLHQPSRSVMRRVFGANVMLYRVHNPAHFRVHVERASAQGFFRDLTQVAR